LVAASAMHRASWACRSRPTATSHAVATRRLKMRIKEITDTRVHYGYRRVHVMLRREGHADNVRRVYRLYRSEGLSLRLKRPRRNKAAKLRQPKQIAFAINEVWSMDFVADALFDGRKLRMLTVSTATRASAWPSMWGRASKEKTWSTR